MQEPVEGSKHVSATIVRSLASELNDGWTGHALDEMVHRIGLGGPAGREQGRER